MVLLISLLPQTQEFVGILAENVACLMSCTRLYMGEAMFSSIGRSARVGATVAGPGGLHKSQAEGTYLDVPE